MSGPSTPVAFLEAEGQRASSRQLQATGGVRRVALLLAAAGPSTDCTEGYHSGQEDLCGGWPSKEVGSVKPPRRGESVSQGIS